MGWFRGQAGGSCEVVVSSPSRTGTVPDGGGQLFCGRSPLHFFVRWQSNLGGRQMLVDRALLHRPGLANQKNSFIDGPRWKTAAIRRLHAKGSGFANSGSGGPQTDGGGEAIFGVGASRRAFGVHGGGVWRSCVFRVRSVPPYIPVMPR